MIKEDLYAACLELMRDGIEARAQTERGADAVQRLRDKWAAETPDEARRAALAAELLLTGGTLSRARAEAVASAGELPVVLPAPCVAETGGEYDPGRPRPFQTPRVGRQRQSKKGGRAGKRGRADDGDFGQRSVTGVFLLCAVQTPAAGTAKLVCAQYWCGVVAIPGR